MRLSWQLESLINILNLLTVIISDVMKSIKKYYNRQGNGDNFSDIVFEFKYLTIL